ncbi:hypothetical protein BJ508DRAFT_245542 [Ascobolus immersus RN42]|uniref:Nephrocystin 3-like N-terminal domain-containing protein n=1 Tax=Ascobolus immersus RN42 TaxID=1160509 RepID=A0A3N4HG98_ASCIM|nr:hypothetical protein BJ508DRAFT_245542 [Ascobolus immersus RN42]
MKEKQTIAQEHLENLNRSLQKLSRSQTDHFQSVRAKEEMKQKKRIEDWLSVLDYTATQNSKVINRATGTGTWVLRDPRYERWKNSGTEASCLWCCGVPGVGKSFITSVIIEDLEAASRSRKNIAVAYIYCDYKNQEPDAKDYLGCILKQLLQRKRSVPDEVKASFAKHHQGKSQRPHISEVVHLLQKVAETFSRVYVVIDALDESVTRGADKDDTSLMMVDKLKGLNKHISFLVTSRDTVGHMFERVPKLTISAHEDDLKAYIENYLWKNDRLAKKLSGREELQQKITDKVLHHAEKM